VPSLTECIAGIATVGFFCLGYMQLFSLTCRGFSLRILVDFVEKGAMDMPRIIDGYGDGRGLDWMFEKRIASLEAFRLLEHRGDGLHVLPRGALAGHLGLLVKKVLNMGLGG